MKLARLAPALLAAGLFVTACGGGGTATATPSANVPSDLSISSFTADFSYMAKLADLTKAGKGMVGVILPDTTSSARYVAFDQPYLTQAFQQSHGVKIISYDRATFTGTNTYYVSFDNVQVGKLIGKGFTDCVTAWGVKNPKVFTLNGGQNSDPNAVDFAKGYNSVIWGESVAQEKVGKTNSAGYTLVGDQIATDWKNDVGGTIFQQQITAHPEINATVEANDGLGNAVIQVLKNKKIKAKSIPTTGQDATLDGMVNVLTDYQCGSVYKAVYLEAQDAVALATVLRAGATPPSGLVNGTTAPPSGVSGNQQPASLLVPVWVDKSNMEATVIKDKFIDVATLCSKAGAAVCSANNIS